MANADKALAAIKERLFLVVGLSSVAVILGGFLIWPGPQHRKAEAERAHAASVEAEKRRVVADLAEQAAIAEENKVMAKKRASASNETLRGIVEGCQANIGSEVSSRDKLFPYFFPAYGPDDLKRFGELALGFGMKMGRPSRVMDGEVPYDAVAFNIATIRTDPLADIEFVVEGASDGFAGVTQWAATYRCKLRGLDIVSVDRKDYYAIN